MDWDKLKIFYAVAEAGSFTSATVILNISQSAISRQIQSLEEDLKVKLFERHARGLTLTQNGEYLFKTAHEVISKLKDVESTFRDEKDKLKNGTLFEYGLNTANQGSGILSVSNLRPNPRDLIANFIRARLENQDGYMWKNRNRAAE